MTQHLATTQDLAHTNALMAKGFEAVNQRFGALDKILEVRFAALKAEVGATRTELEGRLLKKLSAIVTFLLAAMMSLQAMLR